MPRIPRLNQICSHSTVAVDRYGDKTKDITTNMSCRFSDYHGTYRDARGKDIDYQASVHLDVSPLVNQGDCITFDNKDFYVIEAYHTNDLKGNLLFQYCYLKESVFL